LRDFGGISFYFSGDGIDMSSRGGRLTADIQVAIARNYIDNLREETIKGLYGRLKQGVYPFKAPIGYLDVGGKGKTKESGKGRLKNIDPIKAPVIKEAFRLCAEERYTLDMLRRYLADHGLTTSTNTMYGLNTMHKIMHNPFYIGIMRVKDKSFLGKHEPIVSPQVFNKAQSVLSRRKTTGTSVHNYLYAKSINCACGRKLIGEKQKS